ncbi:DoxX family protein [Streptomyces sp. VRA16 Mangrove soil]|uniref:DoxX family protein n=1 Tax=Streptomyces sp. VRA16 Mangrove soil TaxID=2817434 RepID=UPI001A9D71EE|nr:DoxX family protein [Streptomyces sp. VRA16 Mangrove soil]MBO1335395.1 DoxX family protein [Streptomyces sp. VRA16 Mangrove soil]
MTNLAPASTSDASTADAAAPVRSRRARIALNTTAIVLAAFFAVASALPKLFAVSAAVDSFDTIGWGAPGMYTIGALELAGAVGLLVPVLSGFAPVALSGLMVGACVTQIVAFDGENAATPLILMVPLLVLAWARRGRNRELVALVRRVL